jgi:hypothetical protein
MTDTTITLWMAVGGDRFRFYTDDEKATLPPMERDELRGPYTGIVGIVEVTAS